MLDYSISSQNFNAAQRTVRKSQKIVRTKITSQSHVKKKSSNSRRITITSICYWPCYKAFQFVACEFLWRTFQAENPNFLLKQSFLRPRENIYEKLREFVLLSCGYMTPSFFFNAYDKLYIRWLVHMPNPNAWWLGAFQGRELKKYCYKIFVMKYFYNFLTILLGIVVSALAFHAGGRGSIPRLSKSSN